MSKTDNSQLDKPLKEELRELIAQGSSGISDDQFCYETVLRCLTDAIHKCQDEYSRIRYREMVNKLKADHPQYRLKPSALSQIKDAEVIELTEVFGDGFNKENSNPDVQINNITEALLYLRGGQIAGFQIGSYIAGCWSPVGVVRRWGNDGGVQIKQINVLGQEGSGSYESIDSTNSSHFLQILLDLATINPESKVHSFHEKRGLVTLSENECQPQFKAL